MNHHNTFARKLQLSESKKNVNAKRSTQNKAGYYHVIEKSSDRGATQLGHKPYQCDIELR